MMGLIDGSEVSPRHVYTETSLPPVFKCQAGEPVSASEIATTVTMAEIQGTHGLRTPAPSDAQRDFTIAFVAESHERFLTPTEMTFYEILAAHYTTAGTRDEGLYSE